MGCHHDANSFHTLRVCGDGFYGFLKIGEVDVNR